MRLREDRVCASEFASDRLVTAGGGILTAQWLIQLALTRISMDFIWISHICFTSSTGVRFGSSSAYERAWASAAASIMGYFRSGTSENRLNLKAAGVCSRTLGQRRRNDSSANENASSRLMNRFLGSGLQWYVVVGSSKSSLGLGLLQSRYNHVTRFTIKAKLFGS